MVEFQYFMVRVHRTPEVADTAGFSPAGAGALHGVVERLSSGEKRAFASANELLQLVATWTESTPNVQSEAGSRNQQA